MFSDGVLETGHGGEVVDVAVDASGKHLATASDDGCIHIYEAVGQGTKPKAGGGAGSAAPRDGGHEASDKAAAGGDGGGGGILGSADDAAGREGTFSSAGPSWRLSCKVTPPTSAEGAGAAPVTCIAWAPLVYYGSAIVSCTEDGQVYLWSDFSGNKQYEPVYRYTLPSAGCCVAWAPQEYGKLFAVGCASGVVAVFTGQDQTWDVQFFNAHHRGCLSLSFAPFFPPGALLMAPLESEVDPTMPPPPVPIAPPRMATCGAGKAVKVWMHSFAPPTEASSPGAEDAPPESVWTPTELMTGPLSSEGAPASFQKVSWAPSVGLPFTYIAAATDDGFIVVWSQDGPFHPDAPWQFVVLPQQMPDRVTNLSWSSAGTFLLISCADGTAAMWKEASVGYWELVSEMESPVTTPA